ncbi:MAG: hypothetical protein Q8R15_01360 [Candidatus Micrarchaeota archaeon]|nr:hypothetical protein [Candidatus Micrarchaeota archaeon]
MRLFKHGDSLAIVVPDAICKKNNLKEQHELEFFEVEPGLLVLASRENIQNKLKKQVEPLMVKTASPRVIASTAKPAASLPSLLVFSTEAEARVASSKLEVQLAKGEMLAVLGLDKKYYLISNDFYNKTAAKIAPLLNTEKTFTQLGAESALPLRDLTAVLQAMKEKGEVIEKKKGNFLLVK